MSDTQKALLVVLAVVIIGGVWLAVRDSGGEEATGGNGEAGTQQEGGVAAFAESVNMEITGIDAGAGIMINTEKAMEQYGLSEAGWELKASSSPAMLAAVQDAVDNNEPIVATVWEPHAVFAVADLRKLEDPQKVYNDPDATRSFLEEYAPDYADADVQSDVLASVVYTGFEDEAPAAYAFFENFNIDADTQSQWIKRLSIDDEEPETIAEEWVAENQAMVEQFKPADAELGLSELTLGLPPWPGATVKSAVVAQILEDMGYEVETQEMDAGVVYTSLADKQIHATVAGWLPTTHQEYWKAKSDQIEIAGINVTRTWLGLGVPDYVSEDIQSIEDLAEL